MRNKLTLAVASGLALAFTLSCSSDNKEGDPSSSSNNSTPSQIVYGEPVSHGGETYETVVIGTQTWFKRNLNYDVPNNKCYDNDPANCTKYGRLYDWATAKSVCPAGWHLPSDAEWDVLLAAVGGSSIAGGKLKATNGWNNNGNGTDNYGFSAMPGGFGFSDGSFDRVGNKGGWWSDSENNSDYFYIWGMRYGYEGVYYSYDDKCHLCSVRCVKD